MSPRALLALCCLCACAAEGPAAPSVDLTGEQVEVVLLGGGFARVAGQRLPLDEFVVRLRLRMRALPVDQRQALWVQIRVAPDAGPDAVASVPGLIEQLTVMGVRQVQYP